SSNFRVTVRDTQYFPTRRSSDLARAKLALPEALHGRHNSLGQEHHDQHHGDAVHDPLDLGAGHFAQANRKNAKDDSTDDGSDQRDRKSTRLNSSHVKISYAVFCL